MEPQVSIVLLCFNQAAFVEEAFWSAVNQTYSNIQLLVVDDGSTDGSKDRIERLLFGRPDIPFLNLPDNWGNCRAFNQGLKLATGKYIIDFAADDVLRPERVARQVEFFESLAEDFGVIYSNARYIESAGMPLRNHFSEHARPPSGDVYSQLISTFFIPPPTMMIRKKVLDELGGYDESLAYEDFDFWVRSARNYKFAYQQLVLTDIRRQAGSLSTRAYRKGDRQLYSTYLVCEKIRIMNRTEEERKSLVRRLRYEIRHSVFSANFEEGELFLRMLKEVDKIPPVYKLLQLINYLKLDLSLVRRIYQVLMAKFSAPKMHFQ